MKKSILILLFISMLPLKEAAAQFQSEEKPYRIGVLACIRQYNPAPALLSYVELEPQIALWIGDNIYADTEDDPQVIIDSYAELASKPGFAELKAMSDFIVTWDDHDFGDNNEGGSYQLKEESMQIFREFWEMEDLIPADQPGIYHSRMVDTGGFMVQFIMLDARYNRDDPRPDGEGDTLGEEQWAWLESELKKEADLRFVVSGYQILLNNDVGSETWEDFPNAKQRLFDLIRQTGTEDVIFVAGDQHYGEVNRQPRALGYDAVELQFASVNQIEDPEKNIYRVSTVASSRDSYAWIDLYPFGTEEDIPHLQFTIRSHETDQNEVSYRVNLHELKMNITMEGADRFLDETQITFSHPYPGLQIRYSLNGGDPDRNSPVVTGPLSITENRTLRYALFDDEGNRRSKVKTKSFMRLSPRNAEKISKTELQNGLKYGYFEGEFEQLPDFEGQSLLAEGISKDLKITDIARQDDHYAILFEGYLEVEKTGLYTLATRSDDGSKLFIGDELIVDNDGSHSARTRDGLIALEAGLHPVRIEYFEDYSGQSLKVMMAFKDGELKNIPLTHFWTLK